MPDQSREAVLKFKIEDIDSVMSELEALRAKIEGVLSLSDGSARASAGVEATTTGAAPTLRLPSVSGTGGGAITPGATFAANDPTIPLNTPPQGSQQQQRTAPGASTGTYQGAADLDRTQRYTRDQLRDATTPPEPRTLSEWITRSIRTAPSQMEDVVSQIPGAMAMGRFLANPVVALAGAVIAGGVAYGTNYLNTVATEMSWAQGGIGVTPGMRGQLEAQRNYGWIPFVGPLIMRSVQARMNLTDATWGTSKRAYYMGGADIEDDLKWYMATPEWRDSVLHPQNPGLVGTPTERSVQPWADESLKILNMTMTAAPWMTLPGMKENLVNAYIGIAGEFERFKMLGVDMLKGALGVWARPEWALARTGILDDRATGALRYLPWSPGMANTMTSLYAATGDVEALSAVLPFANEAQRRWALHAVATQQRRSAMVDLYSAQAGELGLGAGAMEAHGETGESIFETRREQQERYRLAMNEASQRLRVLYRVRQGVDDPNTAAAYDLLIAQETGRYRQIQGAYAQTGREAGFGWLNYNTGMLESSANIARLEGRNPAEYMRGEAAWYGSLLANPEAFLGRNVRLSPAEHLAYYQRQRAAELGAIEAGLQYTGGIALSRQRGTQAGIGARLAGGEIWSPGMEAEFENVGSFTRDRIRAIDDAIQEYAAKGITEGSRAEGLRAERAELTAALRQVQAQAFQTKYSLLSIPMQTALAGAEAGVSRVAGLGLGAEELREPFALQRASADVGYKLAQNKYLDAVGMFGPNSTYALQAAAEMEQARARKELLPLQQVETEYAQRSRPWAAYAGGYSEQAGIEKAMYGSRRALPNELSAISMADMLAGVAADKYEAVRNTPGVGPAAVAEAWREKVGAESAAKERVLGLGDYTLPPELAERLDQAKFAQDVLQSTMTARGSVRAQARERMGVAEEGIADLLAERDKVMAYVPASARPFVEHRYGEKLRALQMERVGAEQELQEGWLERLTANVWNAPGNFGLVANEFSYSGAVMRHGVRARHLGSTSADLDFYREQAGDYFTYGGAGKFGTPRQFIENALAGVTDVGGGLLPPVRRRSAGAPGLESAPPLPGASAAPSQVIEVRVVVEDPQGNILGSSNRIVSNEFGNSLMVNVGLNGTMSP